MKKEPHKQHTRKKQPYDEKKNHISNILEKKQPYDEKRTI